MKGDKIFHAGKVNVSLKFIGVYIIELYLLGVHPKLTHDF